jgi:cobalt-zinc-cadmium efflux system protein
MTMTAATMTTEPHDHDHEGKHSHSHGVSANADAKRLSIALALIVGFMVVEVVAGIVVHSLALLSDAAHMLTDAGALAMSLVVIRLAQRPAGGDLTYGLKRTEILSAQANGATLLVLAGLIVYEGVSRLINPPAAGGLAILIVALAGIGVNLLATWQLAKANRESMKIEGSFQHLVTDLFAFIATAIAGAIILATGFTRADGIASLLIAAIMLKAAYGLLKDSGRVLLEAAPEGMASKRSALPSAPTRTSKASTTCTSGKSRPASRRSPLTYSFLQATTATAFAVSSNKCSTSSSASTTRRCRSTTAAAVNC